MLVKIGYLVKTFDNHCGEVIRIIKNDNEPQCYVKLNDGKIWFCPISDIVSVEKDYDFCKE